MGGFMSDEEKKSGGGIAGTIGAVAGAAGAGTLMYNHEATSLIDAARTGSDKAPEAIRDAVKTTLDGNKGLARQNNAISELTQEGAEIRDITVKKGERVVFEGKSGKPGNVVGKVELHGVKEIPPSAVTALETEASHTLTPEEVVKLTEKGGWKDKVVKTATKELNSTLRTSDAVKEAGILKNMKLVGGKGKILAAGAAGAVALGFGAKAVFGGKGHTEAVSSARDEGAAQETAR